MSLATPENQCKCPHCLVAHCLPVPGCDTDCGDAEHREALDLEGADLYPTRREEWVQRARAWSALVGPDAWGWAIAALVLVFAAGCSGSGLAVEHEKKLLPAGAPCERNDECEPPAFEDALVQGTYCAIGDTPQTCRQWYGFPCYDDGRLNCIDFGDGAICGECLKGAH